MQITDLEGIEAFDIRVGKNRFFTFDSCLHVTVMGDELFRQPSPARLGWPTMWRDCSSSRPNQGKQGIQFLKIDSGHRPAGSAAAGFLASRNKQCRPAEYHHPYLVLSVHPNIGDFY